MNGNERKEEEKKICEKDESERRAREIHKVRKLEKHRECVC